MENRLASLLRYARQLGHGMAPWIRDDAEQEAAAKGIELLAKRKDFTNEQIRKAMRYAVHKLARDLASPVPRGDSEDEDWAGSFVESTAAMDMSLTEEERQFLTERVRLGSKGMAGSIPSVAVAMGTSVAGAIRIREGLKAKVRG